MICQPLGHLLGPGSRAPGPGSRTQDPGPGTRYADLLQLLFLQNTEKFEISIFFPPHFTPQKYAFLIKIGNSYFQ